jgi:hypothetical protein
MSKSLKRIAMERAIELVEAGWAQGFWAADKNGARIDWTSQDAVAFCAVGAILRATYDLIGQEREPLIWEVRHCAGLTSEEAAEMMANNDFGTKETTLQMMRDRLATL